MTSTLPSILIVDDDSSMRESLSQLLELEGFQPLQAASCAEGWEICQAPGSRPDLVLLDWHMPQVDGLKCLELRLQDPDLLKIPVIVLTATSRPEPMLQPERLHVAEILIKPFPADDLTHAIRKHLR